MAVIFDQVTKRYQGREVLSQLDWRIAKNERWLIQGPSGAGKTTLLRLLAGLEQPDAGRISGTESVRFSMCFQENRLCSKLNSVMNVTMVCDPPDPQRARAALAELLPDEALSQSAETLSGGMARRVALVRALLAPSDIVVLDEPFSGLDAENRGKALAFLEKWLGGRSLVLVSHEISELQGAKLLHL